MRMDAARGDGVRRGWPASAATGAGVSSAASSWRPIRPSVVASTPVDKWDPLLVSVGLLVAFSIGRLQLVVHQLNGLHSLFVIGAVAVALYTLDPAPARAVRWSMRKPTLLLLALCAWMVLGLPTSILVHQSLSFLVNNFSKTVLIFLVVAGCVRSLRDVERIAWCYFMAVVVYAAFILIRYHVGGADWRLGTLVTYDANDYALLATTAIPLGVGSLVREGRRAWARAVDAAGLLVVLVAFVWAGSRGGLLAIGASSLFFLVRSRAVSRARKAAAITIVGGVIVVFAGARFWSDMGTIVSPAHDYNYTSETGRLDIWKRGLAYMADHPAFGVGVDNFEVAEGTLSPEAWRQEYGLGWKWSAPHDQFVQVGAELGIPGLLLYVAFLVAAFLMALRVERGAGWLGTEGRGIRTQTETLMTSLVAFLVGACFLTMAYNEMLYVLVALVLGLEKVLRIEATRLSGRIPASPSSTV